MSPDATKGSGLEDNQKISAAQTEIVPAPGNNTGTIKKQFSSILEVDDKTDEYHKNNLMTAITKSIDEDIDKIELTTGTTDNNNDSTDKNKLPEEIVKNKNGSINETMDSSKDETMAQNDKNLSNNNQPLPNLNLKRQLDTKRCDR